MALYTYTDNPATTELSGFVYLDSVGNQLYINQLDSRAKPVYYLNDTLNPKSLIFINQGTVSVSCETSDVITNGPHNQLIIDLLSITDLGPLSNTACTIELQLAAKLNELSDVNIVSPTDGQVLQYSAGLWVNGGGGGGSGITSITAGTGLTATPVNPIVSSGTLAITNTAVSAGSYTLTSLTVNAQGQLTAASNGTLQSVVWDQGRVTTDPNFFTGTAAQLNTFIAANPQLVTVFVDNATASPTIDAPIDCQFRVAFRGQSTGDAGGSPYPVMTVTVGGYLLNPYSFDFVLLQADGLSNSELIRIEMNAGNQNCTFENFRVQSNLDFPLIKMVAGSQPTVQQVVVFKQGSVASSGNNTNGAFEAPSGCTLEVVFANCNEDWGDQSKVYAGAGTLLELYDSNNYGVNLPNSVQTLVTGSFSLVASANADRVYYSDTTPPSLGTNTVQGAIDALKTGGGGSSIFALFPTGTPAFSAGDQAVYVQSASKFGNLQVPLFTFYYEYDSAAGTTPSAGKFSIVDGSPNVIYFNQVSLDGQDLSTLMGLKFANVYSLYTQPAGAMTLLSNATQVGSVFNIQESGQSNADYTNQAAVTFQVQESHPLYVDTTNNNVSSQEKITFGGQRNTVLYSEVSKTYNGNDVTCVGDNAFAPSATMAASQVTAVGSQACGSSSALINDLTAVGFEALRFFNAGSASTAVGVGALRNDQGGANVALGNFALGFTGGLSSTSCVAVGQNAGLTLQSGSFNVFVGNNTAAPTTSNNCVLVGNNANASVAAGSVVLVGAASSTGASNDTVVGAGASATSGGSNVVLGHAATSTGATNVVAGDTTSSAGSQNVCIGQAASCQASQSVSLGSEAHTATNNSVAVGFEAMGSSVSATNSSVAIGYQALQKVSTTGGCVAISEGSLANCTTGGANVCAGNNSGNSLVTGGNNTFLGDQSGKSVTVSNSTACGAGSMENYSASNQSTAFGVNALKNCSGTGNNTALGFNVLSDAALSGVNNVCCGESCAVAVTTGSNNSIYGNGAGASLNVGVDNVFVGQEAALSEEGGSSLVVVGAQAYQNGNSGITNSVFIGAQTCPNLDQSTSPQNMIVIGQGNMGSVTDCGSGIICLGSQAMMTIPSGATSAANSICVGNDSLNAHGLQNAVCVGSSSLGDGNHNETVVVGNQVLNATGASSSGSVLIGHAVQTTTASVSTANVIVGHQAAPDLACDSTVIIGSDACQDPASGTFTGITNNVIIGSGADIAANTITESVVIGANASVAHDQAICIGGSCSSGAANSFNINRVTTAATATGGAAVIPALAQAYLQIFVNSVEYRIALFNP